MATQVSFCPSLEFQIHWQGLYWDTFLTGHGLIDCIYTIFLSQFVASVSSSFSVYRPEQANLQFSLFQKLRILEIFHTLKGKFSKKIKIEEL